MKQKLSCQFYNRFGTEHFATEYSYKLIQAFTVISEKKLVMKSEIQKSVISRDVAQLG